MGMGACKRGGMEAWLCSRGRGVGGGSRDIRGGVMRPFLLPVITKIRSEKSVPRRDIVKHVLTLK